MGKNMKTAIVINTHIIGTAVIRALAAKGVPVVAFHYRSDEFGYLSRYVTESVRVPDPGKAEEEFISRLVQLSSRFKGSLLIPTDDYSLVCVSKHKKLLSQYYVVAVEEWDLVRKIVHKLYVHDIARSLGVPSPETFEIHSLEDIKNRSNGLIYPCLLKPQEGHIFYDIFKAKAFKIHNKNELIDKGAMLQKMGLKMMIQEFIPGDDGQGVNYNSYFVDGNPIAEFTAQKVRIDPPFFGSPRVLVSKDVPEIIEPGRLLLRRLGYSGFSCMEFKRDARDGVFKLMEINCRSNKTGSLAVYCGIDFPWIQYRHLMFGEIERQGNGTFKENVYWIDFAKDMVMFFTSREEESYSLKEYVKPYLGEKVFGILSRKDPLPFLKRCYNVGQVAAGNVFSRVKQKMGKRRNRLTGSHMEYPEGVPRGIQPS